jgi:heme-degrading monooxygenase HmoA
MFAQVMTFDESPDAVQDGIEHVLKEVIPPLKEAGGLTGLWLVNAARTRRITVMLWESEEAASVGMQRIAAERAKDPDRVRPVPSSVERFEVYGEVPEAVTA